MLSAPAYYLSPYIKCAGCGWGVSIQGCSPSSKCYCCASVKPPSLTLKLKWAGHIHTRKKVTEWVFSCARGALQLMRLQSGRIGVSVAIFWSIITQSLWMPMICVSMSFNQSVLSLIRIPWSFWGSFVLSRWAVSGHQYQRGDVLYYTWTALLLLIHLWNCCLWLIFSEKILNCHLSTSVSCSVLLLLPLFYFLVLNALHLYLPAL